MAMPIASPRYTVDEIESWPEDGNRYELLEGVLLVTPMPVPVHQIVAARIAAILLGFVARWPDIQVMTPGAVILRPQTELQPDVLVVRGTPGELQWERFTEHFLAVEVASPSTGVRDRVHKGPAYLRLGVKEIWRVDIDRRLFFVSRSARDLERTHDREICWAPPDLGAEFTLSLDEIFRGIDRPAR